MYHDRLTFVHPTPVKKWMLSFDQQNCPEGWQGRFGALLEQEHGGVFSYWTEHEKDKPNMICFVMVLKTEKPKDKEEETDADKPPPT